MTASHDAWTKLVRTAAINAAIWAAILAIALVVRSIRQDHQAANIRAESAVATAFHDADTSSLTPDRPTRCRHAMATRERIHREYPDAYIAAYRLPLSPTVQPGYIKAR